MSVTGKSIGAKSMFTRQRHDFYFRFPSRKFHSVIVRLTIEKFRGKIKRELKIIIRKQYD